MTTSETLISIRGKSTFGMLDHPLQSEDRRDTSAIRAYLRAEDFAQRRYPAGQRTIPPIGRVVLQHIWEAPRLAFDRGEKRGKRNLNLRNKPLMVPWSETAWSQYRDSASVQGLILEHVMPIAAMWKELRRIHEDSLRHSEWQRDAAAYLNQNYRLAVLTTADARGIDRFYKDVGTHDQPFLRYVAAHQAILDAGSAPTFDPDRFIMPGTPIPEELLREQEVDPSALAT